MWFVFLCLLDSDVYPGMWGWWLQGILLASPVGKEGLQILGTSKHREDLILEKSCFACPVLDTISSDPNAAHL